MKSIINLAYVFFCVGILNFIFLVDTVLTAPEIEFSIFSIATSKTTNIIYYGVVCMVLFFAGIYIIRNNKKIIK